MKETRAARLKYILEAAQDYRKCASLSIPRNDHLTSIPFTLEQKLIDAVLTDFINHVAAHQGVDLALHADMLGDGDAMTKLLEYFGEVKPA